MTSSNVAGRVVTSNDTAGHARDFAPAISAPPPTGQAVVFQSNDTTGKAK